ncbi:unnamed protein product [Vicia faba]|uniref:Uncharacterized protein n=1 Tax=Vicia faba TaxID=3906 RepID=A0AAV1B2B2_VICFA|nr:unnamed protein product [Vicia faba]
MTSVSTQTRCTLSSTTAKWHDPLTATVCLAIASLCLNHDCAMHSDAKMENRCVVDVEDDLRVLCRESRVFLMSYPSVQNRVFFLVACENLDLKSCFSLSLRLCFLLQFPSLSFMYILNLKL